MILLVKFAPLACLICFQTIDLASARLALNQKLSLDSAAIPISIQNRSTSPSSEELVPIGTLWGDATGDYFGYSMSLSYNGDALAVGSPEHGGWSSRVGLVQFFNRQNSSEWVEAWNSTGDNEYDDLFGVSTSLSGDGKWLAVGTGRLDKNGYVKLVETETGKEISIVGGESDYFGRLVSVSHDGNRTAIAAVGYVRVFGIEEDGSIFQVGEDILTDDPDDLSTVALSADGEIVAIGEDYYNNNKGRVRVFMWNSWNSGKWKQVGGDMVGENDNDYFGHSLDITTDGHRVVIGTDAANYAEVYDYYGSGWEVAGESDDDGNFGSSVSISDDGSRIVIGSPYFTSDGFLERGRAVVYQFESGGWNQVGDDILGMNDGDNAGQSVAISGDGNIVSIGAPDADSRRGYIMIYELTPSPPAPAPAPGPGPNTSMPSSSTANGGVNRLLMVWVCLVGVVLVVVV